MKSFVYRLAYIAGCLIPHVLASLTQYQGRPYQQAYTRQTIWFLPKIFRILAIELPSAIQLSVENLFGLDNPYQIILPTFSRLIMLYPSNTSPILGTSFET